MSEYMFEGVLRSPDELMAIATYRAKEIERLTAGYDVLLDDRNEAWERVAKLEAALNAVYHHAPINPEYGYQGVDADAMFFIAKKAIANSEGENNE